VDLKSPTAAKAHFRNYVRILEKEIGSEPIEELREFYKSI
jgi:hypothetical protein